MKKILENKDLQILNTLFQKENFGLRLVGGCVRDTLLNLQPKDIDFGTDANPQEIIDLAKKHNIRYIPTGLQHGTVTLVINKTPYEITTLREDLNCDGRHADVSFTKNWETDAKRRDLTINAMMMDFNGQIYDWYNGQEDLKNQTIKFVGNPEERIQEDYLRILRFFRFSTKFSHTKPIDFDKDGLEAISKNKQGLDKISSERIWLEMSKMLSSPNGVETLKLLQDLNIHQIIKMPIRDLDLALQTSLKNASPYAILASQMACPKEAEDLTQNWKLSTNEKKQLIWLTQEKGRATIDHLENAIAENIPKEWAVDLAKIKKLNYYHIERFQKPEFPVNGQDLIEQGIKPGIDMGKKLKFLKETWKKSRFETSKENLLKILTNQNTKENQNER